MRRRTLWWSWKTKADRYEKLKRIEGRNWCSRHRLSSPHTAKPNALRGSNRLHERRLPATKTFVRLRRSKRRHQGAPHGITAWVPMATVHLPLLWPRARASGSPAALFYSCPPNGDGHHARPSPLRGMPGLLRSQSVGKRRTGRAGSPGRQTCRQFH